jgi:lysozyme
MPLSQRGLKCLCKEEGCVLSPYHCRPDPPGMMTIGVGHVVLPGEDDLRGPITKERALELLASDVRAREAAIEKNVKVALTQNQYDALVSLIFNIGVGAFEKSTLLIRLNAGLYNEAADHFLDWRRAGSDPNFLLERRKRERALFLELSFAEPIAIRYADIELNLTPHHDREEA